jgi:hypothetical protein
MSLPFIRLSIFDTSDSIIVQCISIGYQKTDKINADVTIYLEENEERDLLNNTLSYEKIIAKLLSSQEIHTIKARKFILSH